MFRRSAAVVVALAVTLGATACNPEPTPTPTGPAFASEDEAFAAAEETYRAYVDALNARREDPSSDPDPQVFLTGQALQVDIDTQQQLDQSGLRIVGPTTISSISGVSFDGEEISIEVCLDSSMTRVETTAGEDATPADRQPISLAFVGMIATGDGALIRTSTTKVADGC